MDVSAAAVKELREKTGAGMMDCKKALAECRGDLNKAVDYLRQKGTCSGGKESLENRNGRCSGSLCTSRWKNWRLS